MNYDSPASSSFFCDPAMIWGEGVKRVPMTFDPISLYYPAFSFAKKSDVVLMSTYIFSNPEWKKKRKILL
jgi:hypothetical protein